MPDVKGQGTTANIENQIMTPEEYYNATGGMESPGSAGLVDSSGRLIDSTQPTQEESDQSSGMIQAEKPLIVGGSTAERPTKKNPAVIVEVNQAGKYTVRTQIPGSPEGVYKQEQITLAEANARGIPIPESLMEESRLYHVGMEGGGLARENEKVIIQNEKAVKRFAEENQLTVKLANESLNKFKNNPYSEEFDTLPQATKAHMALITGADYNPQTDFERLNERVGIQNLSLNEWVPKSELDKIRKASPNLYEVIKNDGIGVFNQIVTAIDNTSRAEYERNIQAFETALKDTPPELQEAYKQGGIDAYEKARVKLQGDYEKAKTEFENQLHSMPDELRVAYRENGVDGYNKALKSWSKNNKIIGNQYMPIDDWNKLDIKYQTIAESNGFSAMTDTIKADLEKQSNAIKTMNKYKTTKGYDLLEAVRRGVDADTMKLAGFDEKAVKWAISSKQTSDVTGVALPGSDYWLQKIGASSIFVTDDERLKILEKNPKAKFEPVLSQQSQVARKGVETASTLFFSPARMALPEITSKDISGLEYVVGGAQLATWTIPALPKGIIPFASAGLSGIFGYSLAQNWSQLTPQQKAIGTAGVVLTALPAIIPLVKSAIPVAVKVPTATGDVTVWRGINVKGKPVIGISEGKIAVGTGNIKYPKFEEIQSGYKPSTKIETTVMGTRKALKKMGVMEEDIIKVESTLNTRAMFAGKSSPYFTKQVAPEPIKSLSQEGVAEVFKASNNPKIVERVYGSYTMKNQLAPELRTWREPGDIDIQTTMPQAETEVFAKSLVQRLKKTEGANNVKISENTPTLIETKDAEGWHHAVDIHSRDVNPLASEPSEKLGTTGTYSFGMQVAEPAAKIKVPGIGEIRIMRLSETGKRKADAILHFNPEGGVIGPEPHRVKDIVDYYVIIRTYKGEKIANEWARAWGKSPEDLIKLAENNPVKLTAWELVPTKMAGKGSPKLALTLSPELTEGISPSLASKITSPMALSSLPSGFIATASPSVRLSYSGALAYPSGSISPSLSLKSPSIKTLESPSLSLKSISVRTSASPEIGSTAISPSGSISPSSAFLPSPSPKASPSPSSYPKPSPSVSPSPKPKGGGKPSPTPSPKPSISTSPSPSPTPVRTPSPKPITTTGRIKLRQFGKGESYDAPQGTYTFKMGLYWVSIEPPYKTQGDVVLSVEPPNGAEVVSGQGSAYKTIQSLGGDGNVVLDLDYGAFDVRIDRPTRKPGKIGAISFKRDSTNTQSGITIKGVRAVTKARPRKSMITVGVG
jgi:tetratricopeptide (TPR) repeat protein